MESKPLEVFSEESNYGIVRMPGRRFPGCVIQGDSLSILVALAEGICKTLRTIANEQLVGEAEELRDQLQDRLNHYEKVLGEHGIELPYFREAR